MNIDHHPHTNDDIFQHNLVDLSAAATGCMVYDYLNVARDKPAEKNSLLGIYTAVMTDTGCFRYSNTDNKCVDDLRNLGNFALFNFVFHNSAAKPLFDKRSKTGRFNFSDKEN